MMPPAEQKKWSENYLTMPSDEFARRKAKTIE